MLYIGVDIGGMSVKAGLVDEKGKILLKDTVVTRELIQKLQKAQGIDAAMLPINGRDLERNEQDIVGNMNSREACWFASEINADLTIPLHYDMIGGNEENPLVFADYMERYYPEKKYHIFRLGERYIL